LLFATTILAGSLTLSRLHLFTLVYILSLLLLFFAWILHFYSYCSSMSAQVVFSRNQIAANKEALNRRRFNVWKQTAFSILYSWFEQSDVLDLSGSDCSK
jgi:uncharacterized membrane protein (DUF106 family)